MGCNTILEVVSVDALLNLAFEQEAIYKERFALFPSGTSDQQRNDARRLMDTAIMTADAMLAAGITGEVIGFGPFTTVALKRGDRIRIKAGAQIFSTNDRNRRDSTLIARTVTVHNQFDGFMDPYSKGPKIRNSEVHWAGTDGYWCWTDINNVEITK